MTEKEALDNLVNFWKKAKFKEGYYIHKEDDDLLKSSEYNIKITDKEEIISEEDNDYLVGRTIYSKLVPEHYVGSLTDAKIYCVLSNPGVSKEDFENDKDPKFKKEKINCLKQKIDKDYPFYMLKPDYENYAGPAYWEKNLRSYIDKVMVAYGLSKEDAAKKTSELFTNLELFPYHSKSFGFSDTFIKKVPSSIAMLNFIKYNLIPRANRDEILLLFPRKVKFWDKELKAFDKKNIIFYPSAIGLSCGVYIKFENKLREINEALEEKLIKKD